MDELDAARQTREITYKARLRGATLKIWEAQNAVADAFEARSTLDYSKTSDVYRKVDALLVEAARLCEAA